MCVEAAAEAVKLNCRILGVGEILHYRSKKSPFLCSQVTTFLPLTLDQGLLVTRFSCQQALGRRVGGSVVLRAL